MKERYYHISSGRKTQNKARTASFWIRARSEGEEEGEAKEGRRGEREKCVSLVV